MVGNRQRKVGSSPTCLYRYSASVSLYWNIGVHFSHLRSSAQREMPGEGFGAMVRILELIRGPSGTNLPVLEGYITCT